MSFATAAAAEWTPLIEAAAAARTRAHAPYSRYAVGAALLCDGGAIVAGCNVENASYGGTICAERGAVVAAVASGHRRFVACGVVTPGPAPGSPCGFCRQVLAEFATDLPILLVSATSDARRLTTLATLLPDAFGAASLPDP
ncbi:MAG: cytidine deaminase [Polyangiales bacterium]